MFYCLTDKKIHILILTIFINIQLMSPSLGLCTDLKNKSKGSSCRGLPRESGIETFKQELRGVIIEADETSSRVGFILKLSHQNPIDHPGESMWKPQEIQTLNHLFSITNVPIENLRIRKKDLVRIVKIKGPKRLFGRVKPRTEEYLFQLKDKNICEGFLNHLKLKITNIPLLSCEQDKNITHLWNLNLSREQFFSL